MDAARAGVDVVTPLPKGWERDLNHFFGATPEVRYVHEDGLAELVVSASAQGVRVGTTGVDDELASPADFDALISILNHARRQHEHLKAGASEPLSEAAESGEAGGHPFVDSPCRYRASGPDEEC